MMSNQNTKENNKPENEGMEQVNQPQGGIPFEKILARLEAELGMLKVNEIVSQITIEQKDEEIKILKARLSEYEN